MIPAQTEGGTSFKGAAAYYLNDKRQDGEKARSTKERVAWTEAVNLPTNDPDRAWRMMAHTAMTQKDLKEAAGIKATGRKLTKPVFAYSLAWHPDEKPTRDEQMEAARATLKELGLEDHQALIVAHNDEPHAHVHVLVNRVNSSNGIAATLSNSKLKLSEWAMRYEQGRGKIYCPERVKNTERRQQGEKVNAPRVPRQKFEAQKATGNDNLAAEFVRSDQKQKDAHLYAMGRTMRAAHVRQWGELNRTFGTVQGRMQATAANLKTAKATEIKDFAKGRWRELFKHQREERATFQAAESGTLSKLWSMAFVYQAMRQADPTANALTIFYSMISSAQRHHVFEAAQETERRDLAKQIKTEISAAGLKIDKDMARDFAKVQGDFVRQAETLRSTHKQQEGELKQAWNVRNAERKSVLGVDRQRNNRPRRASPKQDTPANNRGFDRGRRFEP
ncbi:relaxase/mobilization nuclease domain-containing protein [Methylobacterium sp. GC_Met_2]|uniref:relaxase/mobilization nuclease domain-containing protein n=1 Tax=Methylobacterium sp. GC_Met_2 TaxID=2937376 RepID=UPI00226B0510|nr:relaxase/mobilization nuclease domain-containing protein [Methylobacterium sp. GC_Met_2]